MLIKVRAVGKERDEMKRMADIFRGRIIDVTEKSYTIELTGDRRQARRLPRSDRPQRHPRDGAHRRRAASAAASASCGSDAASPARDTFAHEFTTERIDMKVYYDKDADL